MYVFGNLGIYLKVKTITQYLKFTTRHKIILFFFSSLISDLIPMAETQFPVYIDGILK